MKSVVDRDGPTTLRSYDDAFERWVEDAGFAGGLDRETSIGVYRAMWLSLTKWALAQEPPIAPSRLSRRDLQRFIDKRAEQGTAADLSPRYVWRLLNLVDRVLHHDAQRYRRRPSHAAVELLKTRPEWEYANAAEKNPLPDCLSAREAAALVRHLLATRPRLGRVATPHMWQDQRNRAMVAVMLGSGVTPGESRDLRIGSVSHERRGDIELPRQIRVEGHERTPGRDAPIVGWAGHVLAHWLSTRADMNIPGEHLFVSTRSGKPIGKVAQYEAVQRVLEASGLPESLVRGGSYRLRHTFALRAIRRGNEATEVARWLGIDATEMARYQRLVVRPIDSLL
jgi:site-specific recombinase XerD